MSTHNIGFYEDLTKIIFELSSNIIKYAPYFFCYVNILKFKHIYSIPAMSILTLKKMDQLLDGWIFGLMDGFSDEWMDEFLNGLMNHMGKQSNNGFMANMHLMLNSTDK